jgi:3-dehydroquinate dehydratase
MKWIEIITLRSLEKTNRQMVEELLHQLFQQKEAGLFDAIKVYYHPAVETDLSIHILWETETRHPSESAIGQQLSYALKGLGQLNYSIWVEAVDMEWPLEKATIQPWSKHF